MTKILIDRFVVEQALEALGKINELSVGENAICLPAEIDGAMDALRAALAEPEPRNQCGETCQRAKLCAVCARGLAEPVQQAEPIGWLDGNDKLADFMHRDLKAEHDKRGSATPREFTVPVYTAPPQRKPLTLSHIRMLWSQAHDDTTDRMAFEVLSRSIEAAHGIGEKE